MNITTATRFIAHMDNDGDMYAIVRDRRTTTRPAASSARRDADRDRAISRDAARRAKRIEW